MKKKNYLKKIGSAHLSLDRVLKLAFVLQLERGVRYVKKWCTAEWIGLWGIKKAETHEESVDNSVLFGENVCVP